MMASESIARAVRQIKCACCGGSFNAYPSQIAKGRKFCSRRCKGAAATAAGVFGPTNRWIEKPCAACGNIMLLSPCHARRRKFCSRRCHSDSMQAPPLTFDDLWRRSIPVPHSGCLLWLGPLSAEGYGRVSVYRGQRQAHTLAYELTKGPIPDGMEPDHLCRVRCCIEPNHLEAVTHRENLARAPAIFARASTMAAIRWNKGTAE